MSTRRTLIALLTSVVIAAPLAACGGGGSKVPAGSTASSTASSSSSVQGRSGDIMFAQQMTPHHEQAVEMADMAVKNSTASVQVKSLATQIKKAQAPEIATMTGWLKSWKAPVKSGMGDMSAMDGMMSGKEMSTLRSAKGAAFDRRWVTMMIAHHRGAIAMSNTVLKTTSTPEVKRLAQAITTAQTAEIKTMQAMLKVNGGQK